MYRILRSILFAFEPERAHNITFKTLKFIHKNGLSALFKKKLPSSPIKLMGLDFPNRLGLAAGLDKNGDYIDLLGDLGFGFIEVGTVTPLAQLGNPTPRVFRIPRHQALINRLGFNNLGVEHLSNSIRKAKFKGILGINIGKNASTPITRSHEDYILCLEKLYELGDYFTINISSPNTKNLRDLQNTELLNSFLLKIIEKRENLAKYVGIKKPLLLKISPDLCDSDLYKLIDGINDLGIDGVIATNSTVSRRGLEGESNQAESGGLSGLPLFETSNRTLKILKSRLSNGTTIIGVGGISCAQDAEKKIEEGAHLIQLYTGLIYKGPRLIREIVRALPSK